VKEDGDLDQLDDRVRQLADPVGREADQETALCFVFDGEVPDGCYYRSRT
jgi:hypothetical protein